MLLMVSARAATSPRDFTVRFCFRSPSATAVTTLTMPRTCSVKLAAMKFTVSVRSFQVPATPGTCAWPPSLPSVPTSRATRVTSPANALSWSTMVLMVFFSSRISPFTSTVILRDRSPRATAVVTSAMLRTCVVRFAASRLTLSVRSFQVPPTPGTTAWPPRRPSVPTSRATRVTSAAKERSCSTIVLRVSLSSRISPRTSTVIFFDRSPPAIAVATSAMLRTCAVRFDAMKLTLSVRSFQVPATSGTSAWPPSLPSVPTSRATRVTSEANELSWSTMVLMVFFSSRISPFTSTVILRERSPRATAVVTSAILRTWAVRLPAIEFTRVGQILPGAGDAGHVGLAAKSAFGADLARDARHFTGEPVELVDHGVQRFLQLKDFAAHVDGDLARQVAAGDRGRHLGDVADLGSQVARHRVHGVGQILPGAGDAGHFGLAAELAVGADLARHAGHFAGEGVELVDHGIERFLQLKDFARHVHGDLLRQVALRHRSGHLGDIADLAGEVRGHRVDGVGEVLPGTGDAAHLRLTAELAFGADLARDARHFAGEAVELVHHGVDGVLQLQDFAAYVDGDLLRQVAIGDRGRHFGDVADLSGQIRRPSS